MTAETTVSDTGELILTLPVLDHEQLITANQRRHWARILKHTSYWRTWAHIAARNALNRGTWPKLSAAAITCTITWPDRRRRDAANWHPTAKALVDGLIDAGLLPDDDNTHVTGPDMRAGTGPYAIHLAIPPHPAAAAPMARGPLP